MSSEHHEGMMDSDTSDAAEPLDIAAEDAAEEAEAWLPYEQFAAERSRRHGASMLGHGSEHFVFEFPEPPDFFPPPPPIPGSREECATFSSHFDNCDISKVSSNSFNLQQNTFPKNISLKTELSCFFSESCESLSTTLFSPSSFT